MAKRLPLKNSYDEDAYYEEYDLVPNDTPYDLYSDNATKNEKNINANDTSQNESGTTTPKTSYSGSPTYFSAISEQTKMALDQKVDYSSDPRISAALQSIEEIKAKLDNPTYKAQMDSIFNEYMGRDKFSYDFSTDPMFQNMLVGYKTQGQMAMENAMAEAAGLTGGYASSWSQSAGQQVFNKYLQEAYGNLPAYQQMALDVYNTEGQELMKKYSLAAELNANERQQIMDELGITEYQLNHYISEYDKNFALNRENALFAADTELSAWEREQNMIANGYIKDENGNWILDEKTVSFGGYDPEDYVSAVKAAYEDGRLEEYINTVPEYLMPAISEAMLRAGVPDYFLEDPAASDNSTFGQIFSEVSGMEHVGTQAYYPLRSKLMSMVRAALEKNSYPSNEEISYIINGGTQYLVAQGRITREEADFIKSQLEAEYLP